MDFSTKIHYLAEGVLYNKFPEYDSIESTVNTKLDTHDKIDYIIHYPSGDITVQERFREHQYGHYNDITFRLDKIADNERTLEFANIKAQMMVYGIVNEAEDDFIWACVCDVEKITTAYDAGELTGAIEENKGATDSRFITFTIPDLKENNAVISTYGVIPKRIVPKKR